MERTEEVKFGGAATALSADLSLLQSVGGAEGEAALATLEKQLICPICLELFNKPVVILPCQHNLCRKCANELYQPSLFQARTTMMINSGRFRCPSCRHEVVLDRHGVYGLQRNLLVENIIDVYKQEVSNYKNKAASVLPPPPDSAQLTCPDHEGEKVNIYCLTCKVPTCSLCKVFGAHQSCQVAPLTDIYQLQKDELSEEVNSLKEYNDKVQAVIDDLEQACRNIEENTETQKERVCEQFDRVLSILDERRKAMTQQISAEQEEKTGHAQALIRCYGDSVAANNKLVDLAVSSMEEPDMVAFVQNSRELVKKVISATSACPTETLKPGYESLSIYKFNFSRQERALRSIDFPKVEEDVPDEPEVESEPEELIENLEPVHHHESSVQHLDSAVEAERAPLIISPPVEPAQAATLTSAEGLLRDSVEAAEATQQTDTDDLELEDRGSDVMMKTEEEEEKRHAADSVKGDVCEQHEGMTTLQCEGGEAEGDAGDQTALSDTEEGCDAEDKDRDQEELQEREDVMLHYSCCEFNITSRVNPASEMDTEEQMISSMKSPCSLVSPVQDQSMLYPNINPPGLAPLLGLSRQNLAGQTEKEEDMKSLLGLLGVVDASFSPEEESLTPGEGALDEVLDRNVTESSKPPEKADCGNDRGSSEQDNLEEGEHHEDLKCAPEMEEREFGEEDFKAEMADEGGNMTLQKVSHSIRDNSFKPTNDTVDVGDQGLESTNVSQWGEGNTQLDVGSSGFAGQEEKDGKHCEKPEDLNVNRLDFDSLQAVTLLFYLLCLLVILQRVWAYIGIFICI